MTRIESNSGVGGVGPAPGMSYAPWAQGWKATLLLVLAVLAARIAYLALGCPYTLVEDEAFYWTWARRPELSYYSKGPGVAWLIGASTGVLGDSAFAVRLPFAIVNALTALVLAGFANRLTSKPRSGFFAACCFLLAPVFQPGAMLATIDGPLCLCWVGACWGAWEATRSRERGWLWVVAGCLIGLGFLFKYTALLLVPGLAVYVWLAGRSGRAGTENVFAAEGGGGSARTISRPSLTWILAGLVTLVSVMLPVLIWNHREGWPTLAHLLGHAHLPGGDRPAASTRSYSPIWTLEYLGVQLLVCGPAALAAWLTIFRSRREWAGNGSGRAGDLFVLCTALPPFVFYFFLTFVTKVQGNWAMAGFLPLLAIAGGGIARGMDEWKAEVAAWRAKPRESRLREGFFRRQPETLVQFLWNATVVVGVVIGLGMLRLDAMAVALHKLRQVPVISRLIPEKASVPLGRVMGADRMGVHATELLERLRRRTMPTPPPDPHAPVREPFIMAQHYGRAAHLEFYMEGRPLVYCASAFVRGGRETQYDYWEETRLRGAGHLEGRDALLVGGRRAEDWLPFFERVELLGRLDGDGKMDRPAFYGFGFRGVEAALAEAEALGVPLTHGEPSPALPSYPTAPRVIRFPAGAPPGEGGTGR